MRTENLANALDAARALLNTALYDDAVNGAIATVVAAKAAAAEAAAPFAEAEAEARGIIAEAIAATGRDKWDCPSGRAYVPAPGVTVSYDAKALDAICKSSPELAAILAPHRTERERPGSLTVKGA